MSDSLLKNKELSASDKEVFKNTKNYLINPLWKESIVLLLENNSDVICLETEKNYQRIYLTYNNQRLGYIKIYAGEIVLVKSLMNDEGVIISISDLNALMTSLYDLLKTNNISTSNDFLNKLALAIRFLTTKSAQHINVISYMHHNANMILTTKHNTKHRLIDFQRLNKETVISPNENKAIQITSFFNTISNRLMQKGAKDYFLNKEKIVNLNVMFDELDKKWVLGIIVKKEDGFVCKTVLIEDLLTINSTQNNETQNAYWPELLAKKLTTDDIFDLTISNNKLNFFNQIINSNTHLYTKNKIRNFLLTFYNELYNLKRILISKDDSKIRQLAVKKFIDLDGSVLSLKEIMLKYHDFFIKKKVTNERKGRL